MNPVSSPQDSSLKLLGVQASKRVSRIVAAVLWICALAGAQAALAQLAPPLLEIHTSRLNAGGPIDIESIEETLYLGRGGKTDFHSIRRDIQAEARFVITNVRGTAKAARLARVRAALAAANPSTFPARCVGPQVPLGSGYEIDLTWYSRDGRVAKLTVALGDAATTCSPEILALLDEIDALTLAVTTANGTTVESGACTTNRQCPTGLLCCYSGGIPGLPNLCLQPSPIFEGCPLFP